MGMSMIVAAAITLLFVLGTIAVIFAVVIAIRKDRKESE